MTHRGSLPWVTSRVIPVGHFCAFFQNVISFICLGLGSYEFSKVNAAKKVNQPHDSMTGLLNRSVPEIDVVWNSGIAVPRGGAPASLNRRPAIHRRFRQPSSAGDSGFFLKCYI